MEIALALLILFIIVGGGVALWSRRQIKKSREKELLSYVITPQYFTKGTVRSHVPGTNKYGKSKKHESSFATTATVSCASVISCGSSSSSSGFSGGDSGGGGASASCASASSCSGGGGCGGGGGGD